MKIHLYILLPIFLLCGACGQKDNKLGLNEKLKAVHDEYSKTIESLPQLPSTNKNVKKINADIDFENGNFAQNLKFIKLTTPADYLVGTVDKIRIADNKIFVLDRKTNSIFIFDRQGSFLKRIHNVGKGPGEYIQLGDFALNDATRQIMLYDSQMWRLLYYDYDGNYIEMKDLKCWPESFEKFGSGFCVFTNVATFTKGYHIFLTNDLTLSQKAVSFSDKNDDLLNYFSVAPFLWKFQDRLDAVIPFNDTIYQISPNSIEARYVVDYGSRKLPAKFLEYERKKMFEELKKVECAYNLNGVFETSSYLGMPVLENSGGKSSEKILLVNKANDQVFLGDILNSDYDIKVPIPRTSIGSDTLVSYFYPHKLIAAAESSKSAKLTELTKTTNEYDNPILVTYTLSGF